jgi:UDP-N-acetylmuramate dehydrogenase
MDAAYETAMRTLQAEWPGRLQENAPLARYSSSRIGGPADVLITVRSGDELAQAAKALWRLSLPFRILGGGSNVLISDRGVRGAVVLNQAKSVSFQEGKGVRAESGASLGSVARRAVERGLSGLEWAATVPGTVGGAVVGNAGAHGSDVAGALDMAEILQRDARVEEWPVARMEYEYRSSWLKRHPGAAVVLSAGFRLQPSTRKQTRARVAEHLEHRRRTQPQGASWGSMFKNPPGDHAGRLIEEAGLKGFKVGGAQISDRHANFFLNLGTATSADVWELIEIAKRKVAEQFGVELELEIELLGDWEQAGLPSTQPEGAR